jgi:predicted nuclease of predicted toxin-antitoxin system
LSDSGEPIPFFTDNDVADGVGGILEFAGHTVVRLRDVMLDNSPDPVVAAACRENGLVLVTHNVKHFKTIVRAHEITHGEVDRLCRVELECKQIDAIERIAAALPIIESEWARLGENKVGLRISIGDRVIRVHR